MIDKTTDMILTGLLLGLAGCLAAVLLAATVVSLDTAFGVIGGWLR